MELQSAESSEPSEDQKKYIKKLGNGLIYLKKSYQTLIVRMIRNGSVIYSIFDFGTF